MAAKHGGSADECEWAVCVGYKQIAEDCDAAPVEQSAPQLTEEESQLTIGAIPLQALPERQIDEATMDWALRELADGWIQNNEREGQHGFYQNARRVLNAVVK